MLSLWQLLLNNKDYLLNQYNHEIDVPLCWLPFLCPLYYLMVLLVVVDVAAATDAAAAAAAAAASTTAKQ